MLKKNYYLMLDTETAGTLDKPLIYDIGLAVIDRKGKIYKSYSLVIPEIFFGEKNLMKSAYYAQKIPMYLDHVKQGKKTVMSFWQMKRLIEKLFTLYNIKAVVAHNASFDIKALNNTISFLSNGSEKFFFNSNVEVWCTLAMARSTICKQPTYIKWCKEHGYYTRRGARATAEILYRFISGNNNFIEYHTGLQDVLIEKDIFIRCLRQHKKMNKKPINW